MQGIKCSFCTVVKESSLNEGSIEQTNFLKLSASIAGTDGQHITETLSSEYGCNIPKQAFKRLHLNERNKIVCCKNFQFLHSEFQ